MNTFYILEKTHTCKMKCHEGPCPDCTLETVVKCKCGHKDKKVPCEKLKSLCGEILCEKKCSKVVGSRFYVKVKDRETIKQKIF